MDCLQRNFFLLHCWPLSNPSIPFPQVAKGIREEEEEGGRASPVLMDGILDHTHTNRKEEKEEEGIPSSRERRRKKKPALDMSGFKEGRGEMRMLQQCTWRRMEGNVMYMREEGGGAGNIREVGRKVYSAHGGHHRDCCLGHKYPCFTQIEKFFLALSFVPPFPNGKTRETRWSQI